MFKIMGFLIITVSSAIFLNQKTIFDYFTYKFSSETAEILKLLKIECTSRKTYNKIFENVISNNFRFYSFDGTLVINPLYISFVHKEEKDRAERLLDNLGTKNLKNELEYISNETEYFIYKSEFFKKKFDSNKQANLTAGISLGIIIFLLIV